MDHGRLAQFADDVGGAVEASRALMKADRPVPPLIDPPLGAAIKDRFCQREVWRECDAPSATYGFLPCGGELRHARRVEGELIVTYLQGRFCGHLTRMLEYDMATGADRVVEGERDDRVP